MTLDKFREAYQKASEELPALSVNTEQARDELHHRRMRQQIRRYQIARGGMAAAVFILCSAGTVAAKSYRDSVINVNESGYTITNTKRQSANDTSSFLKIGGVFSTEGDIPEDGMLELCEPQIAEYDSLEQFMAKGNVVTVALEKALSDRKFTSESILSIDDGRVLHIDLAGEDAFFSMVQSDNREAGDYSMATSYMGKSVDVRNLTNSQGLSYVVFDTVDETGQTEAVHAVISVNGWDLAFTFGGFEEKEIEGILKTLDLTVYFSE